MYPSAVEVSAIYAAPLGRQWVGRESSRPNTLVADLLYLGSPSWVSCVRRHFEKGLI
jgi:hypothetical protein